MTRIRSLLRCAAAALALPLALVTSPGLANAQGVEVAAAARSVGALTAIGDTTCAYAQCALGIAPRWNGLAIVRGTAGPSVANLSFFWPRDLSAAIAGRHPGAPGVDSALAAARQAVRIRRAGAALTDVGAAALGVAAISAIRAGRVRRGDAAVAGAGLTLFGLSVPLQFAADGALSRAVWWHNVRYAR